jgi:hypothetical protein
MKLAGVWQAEYNKKVKPKYDCAAREATREEPTPSNRREEPTPEEDEFKTTEIQILESLKQMTVVLMRLTKDVNNCVDEIGELKKGTALLYSILMDKKWYQFWK